MAANQNSVIFSRRALITVGSMSLLSSSAANSAGEDAPTPAPRAGQSKSRTEPKQVPVSAAVDS